MKHVISAAFVAAAVVFAVVPRGQAQGAPAGDPVAGKTVFNQCKSCHDATGTANRIGPNLANVVGRPAASVANFVYSTGMKGAAGEGLVWNEATLREYLFAPKVRVPGTKMAFPGVKSEQSIADVIAYLKSNPKP